MQHLKSYQLAKQFYLEAKTVRLPAYAKNQLMRAALSIGLNLAEGSGKSSRKDRLRYFQIALGSIRECQALLQMEHDRFLERHHRLIDELGAATFTLIRNSPSLCR